MIPGPRLWVGVEKAGKASKFYGSYLCILRLDGAPGFGWPNKAVPLAPTQGWALL
jgi:hypothetical protein